MESKPFFQRIVGKNPDARKGVEKYLNTVFKEQSVSSIDAKRYLNNEVIKTNEHYKIIFLANKLTNDFLSKYLKDTIEVLPVNIHLFNKKDVALKSGEENMDAAFVSEAQMIIVSDTCHKNVISFTSSLIHEMLHAKGRNALKANTDILGRFSLSRHRIGLKIGDKNDEGKVYLESLDEALTEFITMKLMTEVMSMPEFSKEADELNTFKQSMDITVMDPEEILCVESDTSGSYDILSHAYPRERQVFHNLVKKIFDKNKENFKNKEEVEEIFIKAKVTGQILELANLIEKSFGTGSFRKLAQNDTSYGGIGKLNNFVKSLK